MLRFLRFVGRSTEECGSDVNRIVRIRVMVGKLGSITCGGGELFACVADIVEELRGGEENAFSFRGISITTNVYFLSQIVRDDCELGRVL